MLIPTVAQARQIWQAGVDAVRPAPLMERFLADSTHPLLQALAEASGRILVVGGGKAGAAMAATLETGLADLLHRIEGIVNVPDESVRPLVSIRLHGARPAGSNHPTVAGVEGSLAMLKLFAEAGPEDIGICLLSGGGSALLPAPAEGVTLADKQAVTRLLHQCGASIDAMNLVRKHLSRMKGGRLAQAFRGKALFSLILSDVVGDPLEVIASGPTAPDPTTYQDAVDVLHQFGIWSQVPAAVRVFLQAGVRGEHPETLKAVPETVHNAVLGSNTLALAAAAQRAQALGYQVLNLGAFIEGETREVATVFAGLVRSIHRDGLPLTPPVCLLSGGETTVTLPAEHGRGGRNQEFVLAMLDRLGPEGCAGVVLLSGGTDGEDGPTDAAGAVVDDSVFARLDHAGQSLRSSLERHDAYPLLAAADGLLVSGLTGTNVMDLRVILIGSGVAQT